MGSPRIYTLDALRGVAAVSVALFHFNEVRTRGPSLYDAVNRWGSLGVIAFFVLSGYCVQCATAHERTPRNFLVRRFARIYPAYVFSVLAIVAFCAVRKFATGTNDFVTLPRSAWAWLAGLTLTTAPVTAAPAINWVYWSLSFEIFFYLLLAVGLIWPRARLAWLIALCLAAFIPAARDSLFFLPCWGLFALGVALALGQRDRPWPAVVLAALALAVVIHLQTVAELAVAVATLALIARARWIDSIGGRALVRFARVGEISFSLYLIHVPVGVWLVGRFVDSRGWREQGLALHLACDAGALAASIAVASAMYRWIELPGIAWGRRVAAPRSSSVKAI